MEIAIYSKRMPQGDEGKRLNRFREGSYPVTPSMGGVPVP